jgi:purine-binding chemotaxis protein CheW
MSDESRLARLITFSLAGEKFVFDIMAVRQIIPFNGATAIPQAPAFIEGVVVLRNEAIPIVDLRTRLFPALPSYDGQSLVLVCDTDAGVLGLKVDQVLRIITADPAAILPPPPLIRGLQGELFLGLIPHDEQIYLILDLETLLSGAEQRALSGANLDEAVAAHDSSGESSGRSDLLLEEKP